MATIFSPNRLYPLQSQGSNNGTWGTVANGLFSIIDLNFGGRLNIDVSGNTDITVSTTQARNMNHVITGALTGNIQYILPAEGMNYILNNGTSGAFTITAICAGGTGIAIPQGTTVFVNVNPDVPNLTKAFNYNGNIFQGGTTGGSANAQTITVDSNFTLVEGNVVICLLGNSNSGAMTLAVNGGTAKSVKDTKLNALASGAAASGMMALFAYDGTQFQLLNPAIIPVTGGGTGLATLTAHALITGNGTSTPNFIAPGSAGNVLVSNGTDWIATTAQALAALTGPYNYPIGSYYFNETDNTNPATLLGFGTWVAIQDNFPIGAGNLYAAGTTGGSPTHTLTVAEIPSLTITTGSGVVSSSSTGIYLAPTGTGTPRTLNTSGGGGAHSILNPYIAAYIWKRTA